MTFLGIVGFYYYFGSLYSLSWKNVVPVVHNNSFSSNQEITYFLIDYGHEDFPRGIESFLYSKTNKKEKVQHFTFHPDILSQAKPLLLHTN